ncbi:uncharacterized protein LOC122004461 [Zingiber officinale]|uniref:uncharacterized protein LOC122004461 n=1 Tax=Zingiber officinale TaxID=94328 RepID=UPI001C4CAAE6|nr:uncharacterized protein LOC122004461 [Zingiber officinale]
MQGFVDTSYAGSSSSDLGDGTAVEVDSQQQWTVQTRARSTKRQMLANQMHIRNRQTQKMNGALDSANKGKMSSVKKSDSKQKCSTHLQQQLEQADYQDGTIGNRMAQQTKVQAGIRKNRFLPAKQNDTAVEDKEGGMPVTAYQISDFQDCVLHNGLEDLPQVGCKYTWSNMEVSCKLDRSMVNKMWMEQEMRGLASYLPPCYISDHTPCVVNIMATIEQPKKPFKFFNMWTTHEDYNKVMEEQWVSIGLGTLQGTTQFRFKVKLQRLKATFRQFNRLHFQHIKERSLRAQEELQRMQEDGYATGIFEDGYQQVRKRVDQLSKEDFLYCKQKAKCKVAWHKSAKNTTHHRMHKLWKNIKSGTAGQFDKDANEEEIKKALFSIGDQKAPGPDVYGSKFFKHSWDLLKGELVAAIMEFFRHGKLLKQWNHSLISLVPKVPQPSRVADYRPISCCTVFYKIISKILSSRLVDVVEYLFHPAQPAFVKGRNITDNIHLAQ